MKFLVFLLIMAGCLFALTPINNCSILNTVGETYFLNQSFTATQNNCLSVQAAGIIINGNQLTINSGGFTIAVNSSAGLGFTVGNLTLFNYSTGFNTDTVSNFSQITFGDYNLTGNGNVFFLSSSGSGHNFQSITLNNLNTIGCPLQGGSSGNYGLISGDLVSGTINTLTIQNMDICRENLMITTNIHGSTIDNVVFQNINQRTDNGASIGLASSFTSGTLNLSSVSNIVFRNVTTTSQGNINIVGGDDTATVTSSNFTNISISNITASGLGSRGLISVISAPDAGQMQITNSNFRNITVSGTSNLNTALIVKGNSVATTVLIQNSNFIFPLNIDNNRLYGSVLILGANNVNFSNITFNYTSGYGTNLNLSSNLQTNNLAITDIASAPTLPSSLVDLNRYLNISTGTASGNLQISYFGANFPVGTSESNTDIYNNSGSSWDKMNGTLDTTGKTVSFTSVGLTGFFTIATLAPPPPDPGTGQSSQASYQDQNPVQTPPSSEQPTTPPTEADINDYPSSSGDPSFYTDPPTTQGQSILADLFVELSNGALQQLPYTCNSYFESLPFVGHQILDTAFCEVKGLESLYLQQASGGINMAMILILFFVLVARGTSGYLQFGSGVISIILITYGFQFVAFGFTVLILIAGDALTVT